MLILLTVPIVLLFALPALLVEPRVGKVGAEELKQT